MEVPLFDGDILLLPPPDPSVSYTVTSEARSNLLYGGLPLSQLRRDEYSEVTSQTNDLVFLLIAREALLWGGLFSENTTCVHFYGEPEGFFFCFFFLYWWFYIWSKLCLLLENWWKSQDNLSKFLRCSFSICSNVEGKKKGFSSGRNVFCFFCVKPSGKIIFADNTQYSTGDIDGRFAPTTAHKSAKVRYYSNVTLPAKTQ